MNKSIIYNSTKIQDTYNELIDKWANDFCDRIDWQCNILYGHRRGYEEKESG